MSNTSIDTTLISILGSYYITISLIIAIFCLCKYRNNRNRGIDHTPLSDSETINIT